MELDNKELSFLMGRRLKELRESRGLSQEKLRAELHKKYNSADDGKKEYAKKRNKDSIISKDTLIKYEKTDGLAPNPYANGGMNVEYVRYFADFYGVSADYLIGLSDIASADTSIQAICKSSSIPEWIVKNFMTFANSPCVRYILELLFSVPVDEIEQFAKKCIRYSQYKNTVLPAAEKYKKDTENLNVKINVEVNGEKGIEVPLNRLDEYIKYFDFELGAIFTDFLQQSEKYREKNIYAK